MWNLLTRWARTIPQVFCNFLGGDHPVHYSRTDDKSQISIQLAKSSSNNYSSNSHSRYSCLSTQQPSPHPSPAQTDPWFRIEIGASNLKISGKLTHLQSQKINLSYNRHGMSFVPSPAIGSGVGIWTYWLMRDKEKYCWRLPTLKQKTDKASWQTFCPWLFFPSRDERAGSWQPYSDHEVAGVLMKSQSAEEISAEVWNDSAFVGMSHRRGIVWLHISCSFETRSL